MLYFPAWPPLGRKQPPPTERGTWSIVHVIPRQEARLGVNIRTPDKKFIIGLATSIEEQGQIQECTGDTLADGTVRVWAGQSRFKAVDRINKQRRKKGEELLKLRVRAYSVQLSADRVLAIQLGENLHHAMSPAEEAQAIQSLWKTYQKVLKAEPGSKISMADLARRIGRGEGKVRDALVFTGLDHKVQQLVVANVLLYSVAVELSKLPKPKQLQAAVRIIEGNFDSPKASTYIRGQLGEIEGLPGFFSEEQKMQMDQESRVISLRGAVAQAAQNGAGYFDHLLRTMAVLGKKDSAIMTQAVKDILAVYVASAFAFNGLLRQEAPNLADQITVLTLQRIKSMGTPLDLSGATILLLDNSQQLQKN